MRPSKPGDAGADRAPEGAGEDPGGPEAGRHHGSEEEEAVVEAAVTSLPDFLNPPLEWPFPGADCHTGIPLANRTFGALLWADSEAVRITPKRPYHWAHPGRVPFGP